MDNKFRSFLLNSNIREKYLRKLELEEVNLAPKLMIFSVCKARFKRRSIHAPNLTDELSTAEERRLNQFGSAD